LEQKQKKDNHDWGEKEGRGNFPLQRGEEEGERVRVRDRYLLSGGTDWGINKK